MMKVAPTYPLHPHETVAEAISDVQSIWHYGLQASFPPPNSFPEESQAGTTIRFIFWSHFEENQSEVLPLVEGCDIIAIEGPIGDQPANKKELRQLKEAVEDREDTISALVSGSCDQRTIRRLKRHGIPIDGYLEQGQKARAEVLNLLMGATQPEVTRILTANIDQVEGVVRLDVGPDELGTFRLLATEAAQAEEQLNRHVEASGANWDMLEAMALTWLNAEIKAYYFRESVTARQLGRLATDNPGKIIGVLYGKSHHLLTRLIETSNVGMQRLFPGRHAATGSDYDHYVNLRYALQNSMQLGDYPPELMDKFLASKVALYTGSKKTAAILNNMTPAEYESFTEQVKALWASPLNPADPNYVNKVLARQVATQYICNTYERSPI